MTKTFTVGNAILWRSGFAVDADGCPMAYHPNSAMGLDRLANAGKPGSWYAIVCDIDGIPYVQGKSDPAPGFYVSTTALVDRSKSLRDPARYVDSSAVPYVSIPRELAKQGVRMGDYAYCVYGLHECGAVVADVGPAGAYGEGSIALADALGIPSSPRTGGCEGGVSWVVFAGSSKGWPRSRPEIDAEALRLFAAFGGHSKLTQALGMV